jgi:hypothetical protein
MLLSYWSRVNAPMSLPGNHGTNGKPLEEPPPARFRWDAADSQIAEMKDLSAFIFEFEGNPVQ